nr:MAG TPA: hypothetical protein [Bacteriophage sp.]
MLILPVDVSIVALSYPNVTYLINLSLGILIVVPNTLLSDFN